jgi:hypothetical protein
MLSPGFGTAAMVYSNLSTALKRGVYGVYHKVSKKHLGRYVDEFAFRLNDGDVKRHTLDRLDSFVLSVVGKRLTYEGLTA